MADDEVVEFFQEQMDADELNRVCFDSGSDEPVWASVSHGIYISIGAAGIHRSLGVKFSRVQSLEMDAWKPLHLRMMRFGGNRRFGEFLHEHGVPETMPIRAKYTTRAAEWYRLNLVARAHGTASPPPLPAGTGALQADGLPSEAQLLDTVFAEVPRGLGDKDHRCSDVSQLLCRAMCEGFRVAFDANPRPGMHPLLGAFSPRRRSNTT